MFLRTWMGQTSVSAKPRPQRGSTLKKQEERGSEGQGMIKPEGRRPWNGASQSRRDFVPLDHPAGCTRVVAPVGSSESAKTAKRAAGLAVANGGREMWQGRPASRQGATPGAWLTRPVAAACWGNSRY